MRILIVEDEAVLAAQLVAALDDAGYAVDRAEDGERADLLARTESYDAILLDLGLPRIDGLTLLRGWREAGKPAVTLTPIAASRLGIRNRARSDSGTATPGCCVRNEM